MIQAVFPEAAALDLDFLDAEVERLAKGPRFEPFDPTVLDFMAELSRRLLASSDARAYPQLTSLGFWLRPAALAKLRSDRARLFADPAVVRAPRGLVFHLPPANVDVMFVYSWALSLLAGNVNVVRLPSKLNPVSTALLGAIAEAAGPAIRESNLFVSYPADDAPTGRVSARCDVRMVWGGDAKIDQIRRVRLPPNAVDLNFANRFSLCVLGSSAVAGLDEAGADRLAEHVYNDVFWFDQMACSSPRVIYWLGNEADGRSAADKLYPALARAAKRKGYSLETGAEISRLAFAYRTAAAAPLERVRVYGGLLARLQLREPWDLHGETHGGGVLADLVIGSLDELIPFVRREDQTLTYFGVPRDALFSLAKSLRGRGLDRMVPVGQALNFGPVWDGYDLLESLTRTVHVL